MRQSPNAKDVETVAAPASGSPTGDRSPSSDKLRVSAFSNGSVIAGKYLVEETIAQGGIGVVVVARHLALQQRVAIKYLRPKALSNPVIVERFVREARLAAQITSEHVVRVHDVGTLPEAGPYMVMEYLIGEDLGRTVQGGPLDVSRAVDYVLQACDALAEAHALRIVHRDIKPENMFLAQRASNTPVLKVIDFGISKISPRRGEGGRWGTETAGSERFGTPLYMSPEQLRSTSNVDARTDIWSLGVVLHELVTGALPFAGEALPQICTSVLSDRPIALTTARPDAPHELEPIILKCLEKEPGRRYRNVAELAQELVAFGPPSAKERVARIFEVVRLGGDSIRPPAPTPGGWQLPSVASDVRTAASDARGVTTVSVRAPVGAGRRTAAAALAGLACVGLFAALASRRASSAVPASLSRAAAPAAVARSAALPGPAALGGPAAVATPAAVPAALAGSAASAAAPGVVQTAPSAEAAAPASVGSASGGAAPSSGLDDPSPAASTAASAPPAPAVRTKSAAPKTRAAAPGAAGVYKPIPPNFRRAQFGERE